MARLPRRSRALAAGAILLAGPLPQAEGGLPLAPSRQITFDTREGTWLSVDVSPSGETLVFDLLGDLYSLPVSGGKATRLRGGMPFDSQPAFSPDGAHLVFVSDESGSENVWIANADGSQSRMLSSSTDDTRFISPAWSADGQSLYVSRETGRHRVVEMWRYPLAGAGSRVFDDGAVESASHTLGLAASADGRTVYFARVSTAAPTPYSIPAWHIARRNLKTGHVTQVATSMTGAFRPQLSPDGNLLVYGTRRDGKTGYRLRDLTTGIDEWLAFPVQRDHRDAGLSGDLMPGYTFTPDGAAVIASWDGKIRRIDIGTRRVSEIPFEARVDLGIGPRLTRDERADTGPVRARIIQAPVQSPDGERVAYSALARLYVSHLGGGEPKRLTRSEDAEFQPAWSPDGRWIVYVTWNAKEAGHVWKVPASGGAPRRLASVASFYSDPVVSSDGAWVYALSSSNFERMRFQEEVTPRRFPDLVRIPMAGGEASVITHAGEGAQRPFVTRDAARVYFTTPGGVKSVLAAGSDGDGIDERTHLRVDGLHAWTSPGHPYPASHVQLSPDGKWLLTVIANQLHLIAVPEMARITPVIDLLQAPQWPRVQISRSGANYYAWADEGRTLTWAVGSTFYRQSLSSVRFSSPAPQKHQASLASGESFEIVVEVPRDAPRGAVVFRGATAITMKGGEIIPDADVLVVNDRIAGVGPRGSVPIPEGATEMDASGAHIVPGFVDTHAHWYEIRHDILDLENWSFLANLAHGVTSGLDVQAMDQDMFVYQDLLDAGRMIGPRAWSVGQGLFANNQLGSAEEAVDLLGRYREKYRTLNVKSYLIGNRRQRQWVVQAAERHRLLVTTEGGEDLRLDLTHAIDGFSGNEHALPVAPLNEDVVRLYAESGIAYTPTLLIASDGGHGGKAHFFVTESPHDDPKIQRFMPHYVNDARSSSIQWMRPDERVYPQAAAAAGRILRAGGLVGIGSHAEFEGLAYHWEMEAMAAGGLTPHEVLRAATALGSRIIGRADDVGSLEAGKLADLVVLERNPLEDIRNARAIRHVVKNGRVYDGDTLDEIWPRERRLLPQWHHEEMPGAP
jgi:Tol biopolymer transport system component